MGIPRRGLEKTILGTPRHGMDEAILGTHRHGMDEAILGTPQHGPEQAILGIPRHGLEEAILGTLSANIWVTMRVCLPYSSTFSTDCNMGGVKPHPRVSAPPLRAPRTITAL